LPKRPVTIKFTFARLEHYRKMQIDNGLVDSHNLPP
jgi:hypothetical protein